MNPNRFAGLCAIALSCILAGAAIGAHLATPPLVAYGCNGAAGPIYAWEESDFPLCAFITETE